MKKSVPHDNTPKTSIHAAETRSIPGFDSALRYFDITNESTILELQAWILDTCGELPDTEVMREKVATKICYYMNIVRSPAK